MSRRKPPTFADLAAGAAHGRRVVASAGTLDGPFLAALQHLQVAATTDSTPVSTWGDGVVSSDNANLSVSIPGGDDGENSHD